MYVQKHSKLSSFLVPCVFLKYHTNKYYHTTAFASEIKGAYNRTPFIAYYLDHLIENLKVLMLCMYPSTDERKKVNYPPMRRLGDLFVSNP